MISILFKYFLTRNQYQKERIHLKNQLLHHYRGKAGWDYIRTWLLVNINFMCVHKQNTSTDRSLSSSHFYVNLQRPPKYLRKQKYGFFCLKLYNWYMCLAAEWTGSHHQTHQCCVWRNGEGAEMFPFYSTEGDGCRGKLWCHVRAGKPADMFGLQFKQTKLWQPRNDVS